MDASIFPSSGASIPPGFELVNCPGCNFDKWEPAYTGRDWALDSNRVIHIVRCSRCGLHFTNPRPDGEHLGAYYQGDYGPYQKQKGELERDNEASTNVRTWVLADLYGSPDHQPTVWQRTVARLVRVFRASEHYGFGIPYHGQGRLLDFGCGNGTFLRRMKAIGWTCTGLDFSADAVEAVRAGGIAALQGTLPHPELSPGSFDVIAMRHALEHVPLPGPVLMAAMDLLVPGGRLVITVPHFNSWEREVFGDAAMTLDLPRHLLHFTPETLGQLLQSCGFETIAIQQRSRSNWIRKCLTMADQRGTRRKGDVWLKSKLIRNVIARRAVRLGKGNEVVATFQKPLGAIAEIT
jgi:2-polyprenyl-3-methyl-5-hydroxy-6-metoxy-1,4-benzoquinol methylase